MGFQSKAAMYQNAINKAIDYVARNLEGSDDLFSLSVAAYTLQLANHNSKNYILQTLDLKSKRKGIANAIYQSIGLYLVKRIAFDMSNKIDLILYFIDRFR